MLQNNKVQSEFSRDQAAPEILSGAEALHFLISFLRRQFSVILFVMLLATTLGVIYLTIARPSFTAQAQLLIDTRKPQVFQQQPLFGDMPMDAAQVESQVEVLKSENIASAVIKDLHLNEDPEFIGSEGGLLKALFSFISSESESADQSPSAEYGISRRVMNAFRDRLSVNRIGLTYVILISFRSYSAERAAQVTNAVADAYMADQLEAKYQATRRAGTWLQDRIKELRAQVSEAERAVVDFKTQNNIVSIIGVDKPLLGQQQVTELSSQLTIARAQTAEAKARLDRINSVLKTDLPNASFGATVTDTLKNEVVTKLRSQYLELAAREADWSTKYGPDHLAVVSLRNQMREIRTSIFEELKRLGETYKSDYEIAKQREQGVQAELAHAVTQSQATDASSVTLRELQTTAQTTKTIYETFLQRYMESVQQQSFPISEARLISLATRPLRKSSPNTLLVLAISGFGGIFLGLGIGVFRDLSDRVFRNSEQVESLLHTNCITLVPLVTTDGAIKKLKTDGAIEKPAIRPDKIAIMTFASSLVSRASETTRPLTTISNTDDAPELTKETSSRRRTIVRDGSALWTVVDSPLSRYTEAIRSIKLANDLGGMGSTKQVLGLTSSLPNEGKSTIAFSLAQLMSQVGARTILVDCDLRNPSLSRALAPRAKTGLIDVIAEKVSLEKATWEDPSTKLSFLPVVVKFRVAHSNEILSSIATKRLFEKLRQSYDYVVVDLPPLAPVVDTRAATHLIDSFIFVVEWGRTKIDVVEHALGQAQGVYDNLLGAVLNKVDMDKFSGYAGHRESYYYNEHYSRYGYTE